MYVSGDWLSDFYPGLMTLPEGNPARPMECIQKEGELLYVPEGWYHATVNLGDTVRHVYDLSLQLLRQYSAVLMLSNSTCRQCYPETSLNHQNASLLVHYLLSALDQHC